MNLTQPQPWFEHSLVAFEVKQRNPKRLDSNICTTLERKSYITTKHSSLSVSGVNESHKEGNEKVEAVIPLINFVV